MKFEPSEKVKQIPKNFFAQLDYKISQVLDQETMIDLAKGNPDQPTPDLIIDELKRAVDDKSNHGYTPFDGKQNLLHAIANYYYREYQVSIDANNEILTTNGSVIGISSLPQILVNPGDYVITTDPCYPEYYTAIALAGGKVYQLPITDENNYLPDLDQVPAEVAQKAKILLLNYPNNPTGAVATREFFEQAIAFARQYEILIVNDFAYAAIGYDEQPISLLTIAGAKDYAVEMNTLSKTYDMAGWRVGYILGNETVIAALKQYHAHVYSTIFGAIQDAAVMGLESDQSAVKKIRDEYRQRRDVLVTGLQQIGWPIVEPKGTFFVWAKVPEGYNGEQFAEIILNQANVVVAPGIGFGKSGDNYIRMSLTHGVDELSEVVQRLSRLNY